MARMVRGKYSVADFSVCDGCGNSVMLTGLDRLLVYRRTVRLELAASHVSHKWRLAHREFTRENDSNRRSFFRSARRRNHAAVALNDMLYDRKPQPRAFGPPDVFRPAIEFLKNVMQFRR